MRQILFDQAGEPRFYLTGAGVLYTVRDEPIGFVQDGIVADVGGRARALFDGHFLRDLNGDLLAFVKGARGDIDLPPTRPLHHKPSPQRALLHPFIESVERSPIPEPRWEWSTHDPETLLRQSDVV